MISLAGGRRRRWGAGAMAVVADRKTKLTYEDYLQFPEDESRHEIIDGDHYVSAAPWSADGQAVVPDGRGGSCPIRGYSRG